jgi:hypothetical protein
MSTLPSKPITFQAEIGVIGIGKCKSKLKCPPHLHLSFPGYFYDLLEDENPTTPYVGCIDVEGLTGLIFGQDGTSNVGIKDTKKANTAVRSEEKLAVDDEDDDADMDLCEDSAGKMPESQTAILQDLSEEDQFRKKWAGGYRLPMKGQLQIIIKNPSRTAVKVFLVPYDFRDMPPNTKTFLRQKIYSSGASPTSSGLGGSRTSRNRMSLSGSSPMRSSPLGLSDRERLRDAIHLQFYCNEKKRLYLTKSIRVVYSQRAPDSDEKIRVTCEGPQNPKYIHCENGMSRLLARMGMTNSNSGKITSTPFPVSGDTISSSHHHLHVSASPLFGSSPSVRSFGATSTMPFTTTGGISLSPTRRRSSFGMSMMAMAGVSLADYSVSPVKHPMMMIQAASPSSRFNFTSSPAPYSANSPASSEVSLTQPESNLQPTTTTTIRHPRDDGIILSNDPNGISASTDGLTFTRSWTNTWNIPPSSSLSIALSTSSSAATSPLATPARSRHTSAGMEQHAVLQTLNLATTELDGHCGGGGGGSSGGRGMQGMRLVGSGASLASLQPDEDEDDAMLMDVDVDVDDNNNNNTWESGGLR